MPECKAKGITEQLLVEVTLRCKERLISNTLRPCSDLPASEHFLQFHRVVGKLCPGFQPSLLFPLQNLFVKSGVAPEQEAHPGAFLPLVTCAARFGVVDSTPLRYSSVFNSHNNCKTWHWSLMETADLNEYPTERLPVVLYSFAFTAPFLSKPLQLSKSFQESSSLSLFQNNFLTSQFNELCCDLQPLRFVAAKTGTVEEKNFRQLLYILTNKWAICYYVC